MGSDRPNERVQASRNHFNPRSRMGSDARNYWDKLAVAIFQSTLPHGERLLLLLIICFNQNFNPRSRMGSDKTRCSRYSSKAYFNPRSRMGSDNGTPCSLQEIYSFQSTLPHGERQVLGSLALMGIEFQSTLPHGERPAGVSFIEFLNLNFNPRSRMGSDSA